MSRWLRILLGIIFFLPLMGLLAFVLFESLISGKTFGESWRFWTR